MAASPRLDARLDIVADDPQGRPVLLAEVKSMAGAREIALGWFASLAAEFRAAGVTIDYWMFADLDEILVFGGDLDDSSPPLFEARTADVLSAYYPDFERRRISDDYLEALIAAWLRDLASLSVTTNPPTPGRLKDIGLVERLRGGVIRRDVSFANPDRVRGDEFRDEPIPWA